MEKFFKCQCITIAPVTDSLSSYLHRLHYNAEFKKKSSYKNDGFYYYLRDQRTSIGMVEIETTRCYGNINAQQYKDYKNSSALSGGYAAKMQIRILAFFAGFFKAHKDCFHHNSAIVMKKIGKISDYQDIARFEECFSASLLLRKDYIDYKDITTEAYQGDIEDYIVMAFNNSTNMITLHRGNTSDSRPPGNVTVVARSISDCPALPVTLSTISVNISLSRDNNDDNAGPSDNVMDMSLPMSDCAALSTTLSTLSGTITQCSPNFLSYDHHMIVNVAPSSKNNDGDIRCFFGNVTTMAIPLSTNLSSDLSLLSTGLNPPSGLHVGALRSSSSLSVCSISTADVINHDQHDSSSGLQWNNAPINLITSRRINSSSAYNNAVITSSVDNQRSPPSMSNIMLPVWANAVRMELLQDEQDMAALNQQQRCNTITLSKTNTIICGRVPLQDTAINDGTAVTRSISDCPAQPTTLSTLFSTSTLSDLNSISADLNPPYNTHVGASRNPLRPAEQLITPNNNPTSYSVDNRRALPVKSNMLLPVWANAARLKLLQAEQDGTAYDQQQQCNTTTLSKTNAIIGGRVPLQDIAINNGTMRGACSPPKD
jgi:hypothetical protein